jgi:SAM-dependent MidA family methyltransferase
MPDPPLPLDAEESARSLLVIDRLRTAAGPTGFLPFDRFMEVVLYAEGVGFYRRPRSPLGREGEFYTAAHVSPLFAGAVAERIRAVRRAVGGPRSFHVVELGPGDGTLAEGVVSALQGENPGIEYVLVERASERLREADARLRAVRGNIPVRRSESLGALGPISGVVLANEFLDAQPARRLHWHDGAWHEVGIRLTDRGVGWAEESMTRAIPGETLPAPETPDVVMEVTPAAEAFVRELGDHLAEGEAIVLDYGSEQSEMLRGHPTGTLAAVRGHRFVSDPLESPGTADLSTFVNFTRIRAAAHASGLTEVAFRSQAEALGAWGFPALLEAALVSAGSAEAKVRLQLAAKNLLFGFDRFRALELAPPESARRLAAVR